MNVLAALLLSPLFPGLINKTKAFFAGRRGPPLFQAWSDLVRLFRKGAVYSRTTTWIFPAGPLVGLAAVLTAAVVTPMGGLGASLSFSGDLVLFACLLGLARFFLVIAALDTGSAFEGMGASREVTFSALAEPALLLSLAAVAHETGALSLDAMMRGVTLEAWSEQGPALALVCVALLVVFLAENARIPVDDPNTHLELTMIHEVMVLDHGGPDLGFVLLGATLKLWVLGAILVGIAVPVRTGTAWIDGTAFLAGMAGLAILVGVIESAMARLRLSRVPELLVGASVLAVVALVLVVR